MKRKGKKELPGSDHDHLFSHTFHDPTNQGHPKQSTSKDDPTKYSNPQFASSRSLKEGG